ncbi:CoA-binding protein, partial [Sphingomonas sp. HMWF008]
TMIPEYRAKHLLAPLGLSFPDAALARTVEEATAIAAAIGYPVVLKAQAAALPHKTDAGGVVVGLADEVALAAGWAKLTADVAAARPDLVLDGVLVEKMGAKGIELIVGARRDPEWGPVVLVGFGGVAAELTRDVRLLPPELPAAAIVAELRKLRMAALFNGYRGAPAIDLEAVAKLVALVGAVIVSNPGLQELDLNPVIAYPTGAGVVALDALMTF